MGSSSSATANKEIEKPDVEQLIKDGRNETFHPIKTFEETETNKNENNNNNVIDQNQKNNILPYPNLDDTDNIPPKKIMNKIKSAPIQYTDTNLVLTNFFDNNIIDKDKEELDKINYKYNHSFHNFKSNPTLYDQPYLRDIIDKANSDFGLTQLIQNDFNKMKNCLLFCSNLSTDDERFINRLEYDDFISNNYRNKDTIINIINKNKNQIPELISKF